VVDQRPWPELGDRQEPRTLDVVAAVRRATGRADAGDVGRQREAREAVSGQEAFGREIAVRVEVGVARLVILIAQQPQLVLGLSATSRRGIAGLAGKIAFQHDAILDVLFNAGR